MPEDVVSELAVTNPLAAAVVNSLHFYENKEYEHPGEVVRDARAILEDSGFDLSNWRMASKLDAPIVEFIVGSSKSNQTISAILNTIVKYQIQNPTQAQLQFAIDFSDEYTNIEEFYRHDTMHPVHVNDLDHILSVVLRSDLDNYDDRRLNALRAGLLSYSITRNHEEFITATSIEGLQRAIDQNRRERLDQMHESGDFEGIYEWESLIPTTVAVHKDTGETFTISPLLTTTELGQEGVDMDNCLQDGAGEEGCASGESRMFSMSGDHGTRATLEIAGPPWEVLQVLGPYNEEVDDGVRYLADDVAFKYQQAEDTANPPISPELDLSNVPRVQVIDGLRGAINDYRAEQERDARVQDRAEEYRGMPHGPAYRARGGRGGREMRGR